jgi:hypothetical protein
VAVADHVDVAIDAHAQVGCGRRGG